VCEESGLTKITSKADNRTYFRSVYKINVDRTYDDAATGKKFAVVVLQGASFVRHQIRKMISAAVCVANGLFPEDFIFVALEGNVKVPVPLGPPEGLLLNASVSRTNMVGESHVELNHDTIKEQ
jgi:tRNA pseudouridine(38-40) synthase